MKGSEKQIAWASEIITRLDGFVAEALTGIEAAPVSREMKDAAIADWQAKQIRIHTADYAGDIIDLFKDCKDVRDMMSVYKVRHPMTTGERTILGK